MGGKSKSFDLKDLVTGGILQCASVVVTQPFEVWKTHMGTCRNEGTMEAFRNVYRKGGVDAFWKGWEPKMVESFLKGGILLFSKEGIIRGTKALGVDDVASGVIGGFGGGVCQVSVMGPCTFLITASVSANADKSAKQMGIMERIRYTYGKGGINAFYQGGTALMLRQGSNWASRQGLTDFARERIKQFKGGDSSTRLSIGEEALAGIIGGSLSAWNQPFEVMRIEAQAAAARGLPPRSIVEVGKTIVKENGVLGLFQGVLPRCGLCVAQTLFMVTLPYILKPYGY